MCKLRRNYNFVLSKLLLNLQDFPFIVKTVYHVLRISWRSFIVICVYQGYRVSYRIVRVAYRIVRVSYRIVYHVKNNVAGTVLLDMVPYGTFDFKIWPWGKQLLTRSKTHEGQGWSAPKTNQLRGKPFSTFTPSLELIWKKLLKN